MSPVATGVGSMPGDDIEATVRLVVGEVADFPFLPELPARGAIATMTGRTAALVTELGFDLQPAGWRLTDAAGVDLRRARSLLAQDLDRFEERLQGYEGPVKVQMAGPWTLAATVEKPRGDKVLADVGARRDLAQALAAGIAAHVSDVHGRVPGASVVVQVDEPALPAVLAAQVPTASGFHRHRSVSAPLASQALEEVFSAVEAAGAYPVAHCCAAGAPVELLRGAGARGVSVDLLALEAAGYEPLAQAIDDGAQVYLGVALGTGPKVPDPAQLAERVLRFLDMVGIAPDEVSGGLVLTPSCGLAGAEPAYARGVLGALRQAAQRLC